MGGYKKPGSALDSETLKLSSHPSRKKIVWPHCGPHQKQPKKCDITVSLVPRFMHLSEYSIFFGCVFGIWNTS